MKHKLKPGDLCRVNNKFGAMALNLKFEYGNTKHKDVVLRQNSVVLVTDISEKRQHNDDEFVTIYILQNAADVFAIRWWELERI